MHKRVAYDKGMHGIGKLRVRNKVAFVVVTILIIMLASLTVLFFWLYNDVKNDRSDSTQGQAKETSKRIIENVSKLYVVPEREQPTVAAIQDKDKLKEQGFFRQAKDGDYVIVYTKAKLALLYRESINKLVNVGPVSTEADQTQ